MHLTQTLSTWVTWWSSYSFLHLTSKHPQHRNEAREPGFKITKTLNLKFFILLYKSEGIFWTK